VLAGGRDGAEQELAGVVFAPGCAEPLRFDPEEFGFENVRGHHPREGPHVIEDVPRCCGPALVQVRLGKERPGHRGPDVARLQFICKRSFELCDTLWVPETPIRVARHQEVLVVHYSGRPCKTRCDLVYARA
jgi:hypothetical protein